MLLRFFLYGLACAIAATGAPLRAATEFIWPEITAADLSSTVSDLESDAPAEILLRQIEIDDQNFNASRILTEYVRVKIFRPEDAGDLARVSHLGDPSGYSSKYEIHARVTEPDGSVKTYGQETLRSRKAVVEGTNARSFLSESTTQFFLAIPGLKSGSILEYREVTTLQNYLYGAMRFSVQQENVPCRRFEFVHRQGKNDDASVTPLLSDVFLFNAQATPVIRDEKTLTVSIALNDVPAFTDEPFSGPKLDNMTNVFVTTTRFDTKYRAGRFSWVDPKFGPWAPLATRTLESAERFSKPTSKVAKLAKTLCEGTGSDLEKARAIHAYVAALRSRTMSQPVREGATLAATLNDVLNKDPYIRKTFLHYTYLQLALFHSAGLKAEQILLSDRAQMRFNADHVSDTFLPQRAIVVTIAGQPHFAFLNSLHPVPFDYLPWRLEGQAGLLAREKRQDFLPVRFTPSALSVADSLADLTLDENGSLAGSLQVRLTGHEAAALRFWHDMPATAVRNFLLQFLRERLGEGAELNDPSIAGLETIDAPLVITVQLRWPGFAAVTRNRIAVRPFVLACARTSPFVAETRRLPVHFPYKWQEIDRVIIRVPTGYALETRESPASSPGATLSQTVQLSFDPKANALLSARHLVSELIDVPPSAYSILKNEYANHAKTARHEVVLVRQP